MFVTDDKRQSWVDVPSVPSLPFVTRTVDLDEQKQRFENSATRDTSNLISDSDGMDQARWDRIPAHPPTAQPRVRGKIILQVILIPQTQ
jgi:hypothetical protein